MSKIRLILWMVALMAVVGFAGCSQEGAEAQDDSSQADDDGDNAVEGGEDDDKEKRDKDGDDEDEEEAVPVNLAVLELGSIESVVRSSTNLEAENEVRVMAEAARRVRTLRVEEGDQVKKGQVLVRLENAEQQSALSKAEAAFSQAEREYERQKRLFDQNLAAERSFNDAQFDFDQKRIALDDARREMSYTEVRTPISGTVTGRLVKVGDQVQLGQHLFDVVDFESLVARVYLPERHIASIEPGQPVRVQSEAAGDHVLHGEVSRIAPVVDPKTGTVKVTIAVGQQPGLLPGMFVDVDIVTQVHEGVVLVPKRALVYDEDRMFVYRMADDSRVDRVEVIPALMDRYFVEPRAGVSAGDEIVIAGQAGLKDNALVTRGDEADETTSAENSEG